MKPLKNDSQINCLFVSAMKLASACLAIVAAVAVFRPAYAVQTAVGSYVGDGVIGHALTGVGFAPNAVIIKGDNGQQAVMRTATMTGDASKHLPGADALQANRIQSLDVDGFTVGSDPEVNRGGDTYYWVAFGDDGLGDFKVGSYIGNGTDNTSITGVGFPPDYVIVMSSAANKVAHRSSAVPGDSTLLFTADSSSSNMIQALQVDGFEVGTDAKVNTNGVQYHYVAWRARRMAVGSYLGDGADDRAITGIGAQPVYVIIKDDSGANPAAHRPASLLGDQTLSFSGGTYSNGIQLLQAEGFQLGSDSDVNQLGKTYFWMAFVPVDLPLPVIDKLSPNIGAPGTSVTISGWSFGDTPGTLTINDVVVTPTSWNNTSIVFIVPEGATTGAVFVTAGGRTSQGVGFIVNQPSPLVSYFYDPLNRLKAVVDPAGQAAVYQYDAVGNLLSIARSSSSQLAIFGFTPKTGPGGTSVTISGASFDPNQSGDVVEFNGVGAVVSAASATEIVATVPLGITCGPITVTTSAGTATSEDNFCP
jgi:YD repeat-containing protein